jgi:hypothetical protein
VTPAIRVLGATTELSEDENGFKEAISIKTPQIFEVMGTIRKTIIEIIKSNSNSVKN